MSIVPPKRIAAWRSRISLCAVSLLLIVLTGCRGCSTDSQASPADQTSTAAQGEPAALTAKYVYIDSVPRGAQVYIRGDQPKSQDQLIGVTPLRLEPAMVSGKKVIVMMMIAELVRQMKTVPDLNEQAKELEVQQEFGEMGDESPFAFFDTSESEMMRSPEGGLVAEGPVYQIDFPANNRVCAYFIPRGMSASKFYPLMPPEGSFTITKSSWAAAEAVRYHLSPEQAQESAELLSRAGAYQTVVLSQTNPGYGERLSIVMVGEPPDNERIEITRSVGEVMQGLDY